jgi:membrane-bound ClpP family serine protease
MGNSGTINVGGNKQIINNFGSKIAGAILLMGSLYLGQRFGFEWWNYVLLIGGAIALIAED